MRGSATCFAGVLPEVRPHLTAPQRRALEVALLVEDAGDRPVDALALGVAVRSALEVLARDELVLAVDDLQWLDAASAGAVGFALRRLPDARILVVWARRTGERAGPSPVEEAFDRDRVEHVAVGPLSVGALQQVLSGRQSPAVPRPTLLRLHDVSAGNPFYAIELARALGSSPDAGDPTQPLPVPEQLEELVSARLAGFDRATHEALVLAAAHPRLTLDQLRAAGIDPRALDPALDDGVVELEQDTVRFGHPLLGSVLYQRLPPSERHRAHARLASLVDDPVASGRHLALSTDGPDADVAAELERAAETALAQGAPTVAAELGEHAVRLMPAGDDDLHRRMTMTAQAHHAAGDAPRARTLAKELVANAPRGERRAEALVLLAEIELDDLRLAGSLLEEAIAEPGAPMHVRAYAHHRLGLILRFTEGLAPAEEHARAAVDLAEELDEPGLRARALSGLALIRFNAGEADALGLAEAAYELAEGGSRTPGDVVFGLRTSLSGRSSSTARAELLEGVLREWSDRDERVTLNALWYLAMVELRACRLPQAAKYAERTRELSGLYTREGAESPQSHFPLGLVAAHRGDLATARSVAERARWLAGQHSVILSMPDALFGLVELWSGDAAAAVTCSKRRRT